MKPLAGVALQIKMLGLRKTLKSSCYSILLNFSNRASFSKVTRYKNALCHLYHFAEEVIDVNQTPAGKIDEQFVLEFKAYLHNLKIHPNGHRNSPLRPLSESGSRFVISVARSTWHWAIQHDPPLLPERARNSTLKSLRHHFATALEKANISYFTRKYFMGHRVRRDPLAIYTTTDIAGLRWEFERLLKGPLYPIVESAIHRMEQLGISDE